VDAPQADRGELVAQLDLTVGVLAGLQLGRGARLDARRLDWLLRVATAGALVGHGGFGWAMAKRDWVGYFGAVGVGPAAVHDASLMAAVGLFEIGLGLLVSFDKADYVGRLALEREQRAGGPSRRLVGLELDWYGIEGLFSAQGLPPAISPVVDRSPRPVFVGGRQVGRATSVGWSPILKQAIALASVPPSHEAPRSKLDVEWTVEGRRGRVAATVVPLPFLDLARKRT
jgi:hypothetical protein